LSLTAAALTVASPAKTCTLGQQHRQALSSFTFTLDQGYNAGRICRHFCAG